MHTCTCFVYHTQDLCSGRTPLHYAVEAEDFTLVRFLLENGCDANSVTYSGMSHVQVTVCAGLPLTPASPSSSSLYSSHPLPSSFYLFSSAPSGSTAVHIAASHRQREMVELLLTYVAISKEEEDVPPAS